MPIAMTIISSNIGGFTKKATVSAVFFILYCVGNIVGPQLFFEDEAPKYQVRYGWNKYLTNGFNNHLEWLPGHNYMPRDKCRR